MYKITNNEIYKYLCITSMQPNYLIAIKQDYTVYLSLILICSFIPVNQASIYDNLIV